MAVTMNFTPAYGTKLVWGKSYTFKAEITNGGIIDIPINGDDNECRLVYWDHWPEGNDIIGYGDYHAVSVKTYTVSFTETVGALKTTMINRFPEDFEVGFYVGYRDSVTNEKDTIPWGGTGPYDFDHMEYRIDYDKTA